MNAPYIACLAAQSEGIVHAAKGGTMMILLATLALQDSQAAPARPAGNPANWVTQNDYPVEAINAHQTGKVGFTLAIDRDGKVTGCTVDSSSGSTLLDNTACTLLSQRASFVPAKDAQGRPVAGKFTSRFLWELPDGDTSVPLPSAVSKIEVDITYGPDGIRTGCKAIVSKDVPRTPEQLCEQTPRNGQEMTVDGKSVSYHQISTITTQYRPD